jgi:hypothetical protein
VQNNIVQTSFHLEGSKRVDMVKFLHVNLKRILKFEN